MEIKYRYVFEDNVDRLTMLPARRELQKILFFNFLLILYKNVFVLHVSFDVFLIWIFLFSLAYYLIV